MSLSVILEADGGSRGNPGPAGYGSVIFDSDTGEVLAERNEPLGVQTNNVAEYNGLIAGLQAALDLGATTVVVQMDSKLVVEQMKGTWQAKHEGMRALRDQARLLARQFEVITYRWIPREKNKHADRLANEAMDRAAGIEPKAKRVSKTDIAAVRPQILDEPVNWAPPIGVPTRLILVRHGATAHSGPRLFSGRNELPLAPEGETQALALRTRLRRNRDVAAIVSSPYRRALQTAETIAGTAAIRVINGIAELDFGVWEGQSFSDVLASWSDEFAAFSGGEVPAPQGESFVQVAERVRRARDELISAYPGQTVVVVTHVTPIKTLLRLALGAPLEAMYRIHLDTASMSIVDYFADGRASVRLVNDVSHLQEIV